ncbi:MAG: hypothetical protein CMB52_05585 [Euryarchaeota archaeon]|nr:hypothetical protein [Euryarchaeota archaeon]MBJ84969.1 hypothetical protein [Euryarchaeota archaeon]|tara:strand:- start:11148 stop:11408 length:261 start_codon:yes stop_codon:yes gene_type:complete
MKPSVGDIVKYRDWKPGDPEIESIPIDSRGWGNVGLVISVGVDTFRSKNQFDFGVLEESVDYIDDNGDIHTARMEDVEVLIPNEEG